MNQDSGTGAVSRWNKGSDARGAEAPPSSGRPSRSSSTSSPCPPASNRPSSHPPRPGDNKRPSPPLSLPQPPVHPRPSAAARVERAAAEEKNKRASKRDTLKRRDARAREAIVEQGLHRLAPDRLAFCPISISHIPPIPIPFPKPIPLAPSYCHSAPIPGARTNPSWTRLSIEKPQVSIEPFANSDPLTQLAHRCSRRPSARPALSLLSSSLRPPIQILRGTGASRRVPSV